MFRDRTNGSSTVSRGPLPARAVARGRKDDDRFQSRPTTRPARSPRSPRARCRRSRTGSRRRLKRGRRTITCTDRAGCLVLGASCGASAGCFVPSALPVRGRELQFGRVLRSVVRERIVTGMPTLSRRDLLYKCAATGALLGAAPFGRSFVEALLAAEQAAKAPTPKNELGLFYRRGAPSRATLSAPGDPGCR